MHFGSRIGIRLSRTDYLNIGSRVIEEVQLRMVLTADLIFPFKMGCLILGKAVVGYSLLGPAVIFFKLLPPPFWPILTKRTRP